MMPPEFGLGGGGGCWPQTPNLCPPTYANLEAYDHGRYSAGEIITGPEAKTILNVKMPPGAPLGLEACATIQVTLRNEGAANAAVLATANGKLVLDLKWATDRLEGEETIDIQHGTMITVLGATAVHARARFESAVSGAALLVYQAKDVRAAVTWQTSANPKPPRYAAPSVALAGGGAFSAWIPIPKNASAMIALSTVPASLAGLTAQFATTPDPGTVRFSTDNPNANGTPLDAVDFVRFSAAAAMAVTASFELSL